MSSSSTLKLESNVNKNDQPLVGKGERGVYDKRNKLNELTGREWTYFLNSVWITGYSTTAKETVVLILERDTHVRNHLSL
jgi:hypothetical protein